MLDILVKAGDFNSFPSPDLSQLAIKLNEWILCLKSMWQLNASSSRFQIDVVVTCFTYR